MESHLGWRRDVPAAETSVSLQIAAIEPFLMQLHTLFDGGIPLAQIHEVVGRAESLERDDEWQKSYVVPLRGRMVDLRVRVVMEREGLPVLHFQGPPLLIERISQVMEQYEAEAEH